MKLSGVSILENRRENFKLNALFVVVLVLESKVLYLQGIRCIVYDITIVRPYEYDKREFSNNSTHTLGARGFSCAVSGFGQVLKSNPRENVRTRVGLRPTKRSSPASLVVINIIFKLNVTNNRKYFLMTFLMSKHHNVCLRHHSADYTL